MKRDASVFRHIYTGLYIPIHAVARLVEALRYKPTGHGLDSPMVSLEFFIDIIIRVRTMTLGLTQALTEMSNRNISWG